MVVGLEQGADLHMAQLMPLPLTVSCFSKIQIGFTFLVPAYPGNPGQRAVKRVCVCVCVCVWQWNLLGNMQACTSLQTDNHASTPPLSFLQAGCPSCRPTNSVKALKAQRFDPNCPVMLMCIRVIVCQVTTSWQRFAINLLVFAAFSLWLRCVRVFYDICYTGIFCSNSRIKYFDRCVLVVHC